MRRKPKKFLKEHPVLFTVIIFIAVMFALNVAMLLPATIPSVFYEVEMFFLRLFLLPITLHRIELILILIVVAAVGYFVFPVLWIPAIDERIWYRSTWTDGRLRYFKKMFGGDIVAVDESMLKKHWLKYVLLQDIESISENDEGITIYEGKEMTVTHSLIEQEFISSLQKRIEQLETDLAQGKQIPPEVWEVIKAALTKYPQKEEKK